MKISLNWLRDYLDLNKTPNEIADLLTSLGLEVEGWETVKPSPVDLDKVVTGHVVECAPIPDTDHLSATKVDVGDGQPPRSIVCGAPNVAAGQKVWVALPGANVYSKDGTLFTIGERKVRGVPSQGMICAEDELGIGHDHSGIIVLPADTPLGVRAADHFNQAPDTVIEIGLTPNRADATNHLGVARDLAAALRWREKAEAPVKRPSIEKFKVQNTSDPIEVTVENTAACPRYTGVVIANLQVGESPDWLKNRLAAVGIRPINNVVDVTNYVRAELGQPLHAFDLAAITGRHVRVKTLPAGTPFTTLDGVERKLLADDLMICDGDSRPMCIGGVFGGAESGVSDGTTAIFLESAYFDPGYIRRSMLKHSLRTDAAWAFEKGVDPNGTLYALQRAALLIQELAGGEIASEVVDIYPEPKQAARVHCEYARINRLIGEELSRETIDRILAALEIERESATAPPSLGGDGGGLAFTAVIPTNKPDVTREADVVEEILRVYGLDTVPIPAQIRSSIEVMQRPHPDQVRNLLADFLAANGFLECMSLSLSNSAYYRGPGALWPVPEAELVFVHNTANQGLDCMRPTLLFSALEAVRHNQNRQHADLRLFEFGKVYRRKGENDNGQLSVVPGFGETMRLGVWITGARQPESWQPQAKLQVDFYTLKSYVQLLLGRLGVSGFQETTLPAGDDSAYHYALRFHRGPQELVTFGAVQPAILKKMDIKNPVFFADFNVDNLLRALGAGQISYREISKFPTVRRDLALVIDRAVSFGDIRQLATKTIKKSLKEVNLFDVFEDENRLGAGKKSYAVSFTFEDPERTLQDKDIDAWMQQLQTAFETKLQANIRK